MEREQLEGHRDTIRGIRTTLGGMAGGLIPENVNTIAAALDSLVDIVGELIDERLVAGEHANAVRELIKRPGEPRMTLDGPGSKVEQSGRPRVIPTVEPDPRD